MEVDPKENQDPVDLWRKSIPSIIAFLLTPVFSPTRMEFRIRTRLIPNCIMRLGLNPKR